MSDQLDPPPPRVLETIPALPDASAVLDVAAGLVGGSVSVGLSVVRGVAGSPMLRSRALWRPALLPHRLQPATLVNEVARRGARQRVVAVRQVQVLADQWTPVLVEQVISRMDLTELVLRHLDIDRVVAAVDLEAAVSQADLPAIIRDSSGSIASETVRGARMTGINADEAISRTLERRLFRRRRAPLADSE